MNRKYNKIIIDKTIICILEIILAIRVLAIRSFCYCLLCLSITNSAQASVSKLPNEIATQFSKPAEQMTAGTYIFVSFSMNDNSLHNYFQEAERYGATLVIRGFTGDKNSSNRFAETGVRAGRAKINLDINPNLFEQLNIKHVPAIAVIEGDGSARVVSGHVTLKKALEIMQIRFDSK